MWHVDTEDEKKILRTYLGMSKLLTEFNLDFDDFCKNLREQYVLEAYQVSKTITRTSLKVGIDRRTVSAIIKNKQQYQKPSSIFTILNRVQSLAKKTGGLINKKGKNSLENIIVDVAHGSTTLMSVVNELVDLGCIEDKGTKIQYITSHISKTPNKQRTLQIFSNHLDRYVNTIVNNLKAEDNDDRNFEYTIYSTKIPTDISNTLHYETRKILKDTTESLKQLYEKFEQDVPAGTYEEVGVSLTQFNLNQKEE
jgi:predicted regulator of amino acid metabolism with ACT domain